MSYDSGSNYKYPQQDKKTSDDNIDEITILKNRIALLEKDRIEGEFDYHDGGKINCHPQYIKGYNDGYKDAFQKNESLTDSEKIKILEKKVAELSDLHTVFGPPPVNPEKDTAKLEHYLKSLPSKEKVRKEDLI